MTKALNDGPEDEARQRRDQKANPEIAGRRKAEPCQHSADHEEITMGDIDDVEQAENNRKPERDESNDQPPDQPVHRQQKNSILHDQPQSGAMAKNPDLPHSWAKIAPKNRPKTSILRRDGEREMAHNPT